MSDCWESFCIKIHRLVNVSNAYIKIALGNIAIEHSKQRLLKYCYA